MDQWLRDQYSDDYVFARMLDVRPDTAHDEYATPEETRAMFKLRLQLLDTPELGRQREHLRPLEDPLHFVVTRRISANGGDGVLAAWARSADIYRRAVQSTVARFREQQLKDSIFEMTIDDEDESPTGEEEVEEEEEDSPLMQSASLGDGFLDTLRRWTGGAGPSPDAAPVAPYPYSTHETSPETLKKTRFAFVPILVADSTDVINTRLVYNRLASAEVRKKSVVAAVADLWKGAPKTIAGNPLRLVIPRDVLAPVTIRLHIKPVWLGADYDEVKTRAEREYDTHWKVGSTAPADPPVAWDSRVWSELVRNPPFSLLRKMARRGSWVAMLHYMNRVFRIAEGPLGLMEELVATLNLCAGNAQLIDQTKPSEWEWYSLLHRVTSVELNVKAERTKYVVKGENVLADTVVRVYDPLIAAHYERLENMAGNGTVLVPGRGRAQVAATLRSSSQGLLPWFTTPASSLFSAAQLALVTTLTLVGVDQLQTKNGARLIDLRPTSTLFTWTRAVADVASMITGWGEMKSAAGWLIQALPRQRHVEPFIFLKSAEYAKRLKARFDDKLVVVQDVPFDDIVRHTTTFEVQRNRLDKAIQSVEPASAKAEFIRLFEAGALASRNVTWGPSFDMTAFTQPYPLQPVVRVVQSRGKAAAITFPPMEYLASYGLLAAPLKRALLDETPTPLVLDIVRRIYNETDGVHAVARVKYVLVVMSIAQRVGRSGWAVIQHVYDPAKSGILVTPQQIEQMHDFNRVLVEFCSADIYGAGVLYETTLSGVPLRRYNAPLTDVQTRGVLGPGHVGSNITTQERNIATLKASFSYCVTTQGRGFIAGQRTPLGNAFSPSIFSETSPPAVPDEVARQAVLTLPPTTHQTWAQLSLRVMNQQLERGFSGGPGHGPVVVQNIGGLWLRLATLPGIAQTLDWAWTRGARRWVHGKYFYKVASRIDAAYESNLHLSQTDKLVAGDAFWLALVGITTSGLTMTTATIAGTLIGGTVLYSAIMRRLMQARLRHVLAPKSNDYWRYVVRALPGLIRTVTYGLLAIYTGSVGFGIALAGQCVVDLLKTYFGDWFADPNGQQGSFARYAWMYLNGQAYATAKGETWGDLTKGSWTGVPNVFALSKDQWLLVLFTLWGPPNTGDGSGSLQSALDSGAKYAGTVLGIVTLAPRVLRWLLPPGGRWVSKIAGFLGKLFVTALVYNTPEAQFALLGASCAHIVVLTVRGRVPFAQPVDRILWRGDQPAKGRER